MLGSAIFATRPVRHLAFALVLGACAVPQTSGVPVPAQTVPARAILYRNTLNVVMSEGSLCAGPRPAAGPWTGRLAGCPFPYPYGVDAGSGAAGTVRQELALRLGDAPPGAPAPSVWIRDPQGRTHLFGAAPRPGS